MKPIRTLIVVAALLATNARTEEPNSWLGKKVPSLILADGKTYSQVTFTKITPDAISITHAGGIARVPMEDLTEEARTALGYDPLKAAEARKAYLAEMAAESERAAEKAKLRAEEDAKIMRRGREAMAQQENLAKAELRDGFAYLFVEDGVIFHSTNGQDYKGDRVVKITPGTGWGYKQILDSRDRDTQFHLKGLPEEPALVDDQPFSAFMIPDGVYESGGSRIKSFKFVKWGGILFEDDQTFGTPTVIRNIGSP